MPALAAAVAAAALLAACGGDAPAAPPGYKIYESPALDYTVAIPSGWELYLHHKLTRTDYFGPAGQRFRTGPPLSIRRTPDSTMDIEALTGGPNTEERIVAGQRAVMFSIEGERDQRYAYVPLGPDIWRLRLIFPAGDAGGYEGIFETVLDTFRPRP